MASRAGQKGTVGMVVPERDMPFTADGIRPDIIINPHAIPSRMTIGQFVEVVTGKACAMYGGFGDCTAFNNKGSKVGVFGEMLTKEGFHSNGNEVMYNGMTGEQLETEIFIGPTYYMRLKHMVKDKVNYRALGPRTALTKQPVSGRANDGGLRIGEMERDTVISHGMTDFLRESMMERGDKSYLAVCNHTGMIAIYNPAKEVFMSPMADGPLKFVGSLEGDDMRLEHITKFGRNFSIVCIPYSFKLLIQELQTINAQVRIITEDNIEQIESMSFSHNIQTLLDDKEATPKSLIESIQKRISQKQIERTQTPEDGFTVDELDSPEYAPDSQANIPLDSEGNPIDTDWGSYDPNASEKSSLQSIQSPEFASASPADMPLDSEGNPIDTDWGSYDPNSPYVSPENKEDSQTKMVGGNGPTGYKIGGRVCMRKCKDKNTRRPWEITHMGPKFITIRAIDKEGLSDLDQVNVVSSHDIFPEEHAHMYIPKIQPQMLPDRIPQMQPIPANTSTQPTVIIAPKFFNGNGSDNSTSELPNESLDSNQNIISEPSMVIKSNVDTANQSDTEVDSNKEVDFSKGLVIKKQGQ
jgi:hypothetical protein